jgi:hypothetical protein
VLSSKNFPAGRSLNCLPVGHRLTPHWRFTPGRSVSALSVIPGLGARFLATKWRITQCADIAADLISEPSRGTNFDIAATDQIRPICDHDGDSHPCAHLHPLCLALSLTK